MKEKRCPKCNETKPLDAFGLRSNGKWSRAYCKLCESTQSKAWRTANPAKQRFLNRRNGLRIMHQITVEDYEELLTAQSGVCAICGKLPKGKRPLVVDHNHKTGKFRGLLCDACNIGLGMLQDNVEILSRAIDYLKGEGHA